jgi:DNA-binding transcriptional ArsR family regulator
MRQLDHTFAALADPTRRAILARLALGEATVGELAEPFEISLPAISKHLRVLESAELITREKRAQQRVCRLQPAAVKTASDWIEQSRRMWEERFDRLDAYLRELQGKENNDGNAE